MKFQELVQKIENASSPDFGNLLSNSFELFKKTWVDGFLHLLISIIVIIPVIFLVYTPFIPALINASSEAGIDSLEPEFGDSLIAMVVFFIAYFIAIVFAQMITLALGAHFFKVCKIKDLKTQEQHGGYFAYLKGPRFKKVMMVSLATFGISIAAMLLCILPLFYVMVPLQLIVVIFTFNNDLSASEIITISFKLGNKFWGLLFALIFVSSLIAQLGIILCFVGVFFTAFFVYIPIYYFYKETIGFTEDLVSAQ